jgi:hypothetical protein
MLALVDGLSGKVSGGFAYQSNRNLPSLHMKSTREGRLPPGLRHHPSTTEIAGPPSRHFRRSIGFDAAILTVSAMGHRSPEHIAHSFLLVRRSRSLSRGHGSRDFDAVIAPKGRYRDFHLPVRRVRETAVFERPRAGAT